MSKGNGKEGEAFIRGEDNETLLGTETPTPKVSRRLAPSRTRVVAESAAGSAPGGARAGPVGVAKSRASSGR